KVLVAAAAIDRADARLKADAAAKACGPQDRADDLRAERRRHHAAGHSGGGAAARPARGALPVPGIAGAARLGRGELRRNDLAEDHPTSLAKRYDGGGVPTGAPTDEQG